MKKSPVRIIELFVYALILIVALIWTVSNGGLNKPFDVEPPPVQTRHSSRKKHRKRDKLKSQFITRRLKVNLHRNLGRFF